MVAGVAALKQGPRGWLDGAAGWQVGGQVNGYAPRYSGGWGQGPRGDPTRIYVLARARIRTLGRFMLWLISAAGCSHRRLYARSAKLDRHLRAAVSSLILRT